MINKITLIIPIFNEKENIGELIEEILINFKNIKILVIDDFSYDNSANIVKNKIKIYKNQITLLNKNNTETKGLCSSILKGIINVKTKYFIVMDGDFQHPINNIANFIELFELKNNIVIGERNNINLNILKFRFLISLTGNLMIRKISKIDFSDPLSGFFGGETKLFKEIIDNNLKSFNLEGYKFLFNFLQVIDIKKYNIGIFKFIFQKRKYGKSKISNKIYLSFLKSFFINKS